MSEEQKNGAASSPLEPIVMPLQPIRLDERGVQRFVPNKIVEKLLETSSLDLNDIAAMGFTQQEQEQFAQLIGYSVSGWGDLSYVSDETYAAAEKTMEGKTELEARNDYLREKLKAIKESSKQLMTNIHNIHPEDIDYFGRD